MLVLLMLLVLGDPQARGAQRGSSRPAPPPRDTFFTSTLPVSDLQNKQAVLETGYGTIVLDLLAGLIIRRVFGPQFEGAIEIGRASCRERVSKQV